MTCKPTALLVACLSVATLVAGPAHASAAAEKQVSHAVVVTNHRTSPVVSLGFGPDGESRPPSNMLKKPLEQGKSVRLIVKAKKDVCSFEVAGVYADGTDVSGSGLNLCDDHVLSLVD